MNVFVLSADPTEAARMQCNKHIVKMVLESAQLLVTAFPQDEVPYRHTHFNHPCAKWMRASLTNYGWLLVHAQELCREYTRRYDRVHKTEEIINDLGVPHLPNVGLTPFARAIKEPWKSQTMHLDVVDAYRRYYVGDKQRFARWSPRAHAPSWWPNPEA